jgi:hypothetical protein
MEKLSAEQVKQVFEQIPGTLRKLAAERDFWKQEATSRIRHDEAEKVARAMHDKGINTEVNFETLVGQLEKAASDGTLSKIAEAVDLVGPDMGEKIARLIDDEPRLSQGSGSDFERFIVGSVG